MTDIFAPKNGKKRLVALFVILVIVTFTSLVYKSYFLAPEEAPMVENTTNTTQKIKTTFEQKILTGVSTLAIGGTALLIAVSVVIDLVRRVDSQVSIRQY